MPDRRVPITPETKVADVLEAHPALEEVLISLAPAFARLRNPILRRTVAKVATLEQAARIGGLEPSDLVRRLRAAAGQARGESTTDEASVAGPAGTGGAGGGQPAWIGETPATAVIDADAALDRGEHPLGAVRRALAGLRQGEVICVEASFVPAPLIDALTAEGYEVATVAHEGRFRTYLRCPRSGAE